MGNLQTFFMEDARRKTREVLEGPYSVKCFSKRFSCCCVKVCVLLDILLFFLIRTYIYLKAEVVPTL
jgi:hypothetical protein